MVAAPQYGSIQLHGVRTKKTYAKDVYFSDVAGGALRWDDGAGAGATSGEAWRAPEPVILMDLSVVTGLTDTTKLQLTRNGVPTGDILRYSIHLTTLNNRPRLGIIFGQGDEITGLQLA